MAQNNKHAPHSVNYSIDFVDYLEQRVKDLPKKKRVLVSCFPKSGSTFLASFVAESIHGKIIFGGQVPSRAEQDLADVWLLKHSSENIVIHMHNRYSSLTRMYIDAFDLTTIVVVRNIYDVMISIIDHWRGNQLPSGDVSWPFAYVNSTILNLKEDDLFDFISIHVIPWYINYYVSWYMACQEGNIKIVTYYDIFDNPLAFFSSLQSYLGERGNASKILHKISVMPTRKNIGIDGRGKKVPEFVREKVKHLASFYPNVNFLPIGLPS